MQSLRNMVSRRDFNRPQPRQTEVHFAMYSKPSANSRTSALGLHGERLHQIVVFELREDGSTEYSTMTLRALYNYVVRTITEGCKEANQERQNIHGSRRHNIHFHGQSVSSREMFAGSTREMFAGSSGSIHERNTTDGTIGIGVIEEEEVGEGSPNSPSTMTPSTPYHHTTPTDIPPHLPSLGSSNATPPSVDNGGSLPTPITSNQSTEHDVHHSHQQPRQQSAYPQQHHSQQRAAQTAFTPLPSNGHRERLGGYLHPRDMRRLVTPFSNSNEPQLMVRRHAMLLNFDPLRAVVLRDRLLVLVPDGADSILIELEKRVRGGIAEMENQVFGTASSHDSASVAPPMKRKKSHEQFAKLHKSPEEDPTQSMHAMGKKIWVDGNSNDTSEVTETTEHSNDEWEDIQQMDWKNMPYELQSVDAVLQTVTAMLMDDARKVHHRSSMAMSELRGDSPTKRGMGGGLGEHAQERLRLHKDEVNLMEGRVQGFVRAMNEVLDDDEDMTLMNLSRLLTHPERFLQPVSKEILHEESDEPELILEAYLQQALSIVNELDLLKGQIMTTEEQISMTLDAVRNRLLYINTLLSVASLCVAVGSFVGSIFGMNLTNHIETEETAFMQVTVGVIVGMVCMWAILSWIFYRAANIHSDFGKKTHTHFMIE